MGTKVVEMNPYLRGPRAVTATEVLGNLHASGAPREASAVPV